MRPGEIREERAAPIEHSDLGSLPDRAVAGEMAEQRWHRDLGTVSVGEAGKPVLAPP